MDRTVGVVGVVVALLIVAGVVFYTGGGGTVETPLIAVLPTPSVPERVVDVPVVAVSGAPVPRTAAATGVTRTSANLHGDVVPNGATTQFWFEYGASADLGNATALASIGDGTVKTPVSLSVSGLNPLTTYWFRLNAQNQFGTVNGSIMTFKTAN
ncbi:MAG: hypothetical protein Q7R63_00250 [bacterium]|nr:hypothetical protein [bacterium]